MTAKFENLKGMKDFASRKEGALGPHVDGYKPKLGTLTVKGERIVRTSRTSNVPGFEVIGFACSYRDWYILEPDPAKARHEYQKHNVLTDHEIGSLPALLYVLKEQPKE